MAAIAIPAIAPGGRAADFDADDGSGPVDESGVDVEEVSDGAVALEVIDRGNVAVAEAADDAAEVLLTTGSSTYSRESAPDDPTMD